ncbi:MAG: TetR/AcrR family transcriptional regulator [bacterium]|nr:TetR/AcrR family transcriptional regulator [bacterium]
MNQRAQQRAETRARIVEAAAECFAERGFRAASTREIAARAGVNQGLITYHFKSKDELWRAAAEYFFGFIRSMIRERAAVLEALGEEERAREAVRDFVRFAAAHPEFFRFMLEAGKHDDERLQWLVDHQLRPVYATIPGLSRFEDAVRTHAQYSLIGAASMIFAVAPEVQRLTGLDPSKPEAVEAHADFVARLLVP